MSEDSFTEVTSEGWFSRIGGAIKGILVGLTAAITLNCQSCLRYYKSRAEKAGISEGKVSEVVAKIMAVSANKKRLQTEEVWNRHAV